MNTQEIEAIVQQVISDFQERKQSYKDGEKGLIGFFVAQVRIKSNGQANSQEAMDILKRELSR